MDNAICFPVAIPPLPVNFYRATINAVGRFQKIQRILSNTEFLGDLGRDGRHGDGARGHDEGRNGAGSPAYKDIVPCFAPQDKGGGWACQGRC